MRIGMMVDFYKPHLSGVTNYIELSKKFLEQNGHDVYVFTVGDDNYQDGEENVIRSPGLSFPMEGIYLSIRYSRDAQKLVRTMDVLHVHHPFLSGQMAIRYSRSRGMPIVFTNHTRYDLYARAYMPMVPGEISDSFLKAYMPPFCRAIDRVIAPSPGLKDVLVRLGVDAAIEVVPNGIDMQRVQVNVEPMDRSKFNIDPDDVVLIYVGRLGPEKNLSFLLRAFAGAVSVFEKAKLVIVGDGPDTDNLIDRVRHMDLQRQVIFTGRVPYDDVPSYLRMADAFVTASITEVHPLSVLEAMGAGLPVLGIVSPGVGDTVDDGVTGFLARDVDLAEFTAKLVMLINNDSKRKEMGAAALKVSEMYDIRRTTELMVNQYRSVMEQKKPDAHSLRARFLRVFDRWNG